MNDFGPLLKAMRIKAGFGLRRFAELIEMAAPNLSALENGRRPPPADEDKLRQIGEALGLTEGSEEWNSLFDAAKRSGNLPADVRRVADRKLVPALLRTIDNLQLSDEQIKALIDDLQHRHGDGGAA